MIWKNRPSLETLNKLGKNTLIHHLGIKFTELGNDFLKAVMPVTQELLQPQNIMHGGASCVLAETIGSVAANLCVDEKAHVCVGLDINVNHIRQAKAGDVITAVAMPFHVGRTTHVWDIRLNNQDGKIVAVSRLTVAVIEGGRNTKNPPAVASRRMESTKCRS